MCEGRHAWSQQTPQVGQRTAETENPSRYYTLNFPEMSESPPSSGQPQPPLTDTRSDDSALMTTLPRALPNGKYLLRVERIDLQQSQGFPPTLGSKLVMLPRSYPLTTWPPAQFYLACAQVNIINGGNGILPEKKVAIPGHYARDVSHTTPPMQGEQS